ncbi:MAG: PepSY domain-containing protein [Elainella sp.]
MNVRQFRQLHQTVAPFVILPLSITILTGVTYRLAKSWFGLSRDQVHWLMVLHEGEYLGQFWEPVYVLLNGMGALWMLVTGSVMVWQNFSRWRRQLGSQVNHQANQQANHQTGKLQANSPEEDL